MFAVSYHQELNPLNNQILSTIFAALPVIVLFWLLVPRRWLAPKAAAAGAVTAVAVAIFIFRMPADMACLSFLYGAAFGLLPVGWTIFNAMLIYMVKCMCSWRQTWEVLPALIVAGGSFALFQFTFATIHNYTDGMIVLYPMTDIGGGMFSLIVTALLLRFWKPRKEWHFDKRTETRDQRSEVR